MDQLIPISAQEFKLWKPSLKIIDHDYPRRFASFKLADGVEDVALSWRSDSISPVVLSDGPSLLWVGVDQRVVCITRQGAIMFSNGLDSTLLDIKRFPEFISILCDADVMTVNLDYSIRGMYSLSDIPSTIELMNGKLVVVFSDGEKHTVL